MGGQQSEGKAKVFITVMIPLLPHKTRLIQVEVRSGFLIRKTLCLLQSKYEKKIEEFFDHDLLDIKVA